LCNLKEKDDLYYFIGRCPILVEIRVKWFHKFKLSVGEIVGYLNGMDWDIIVGYGCEAWLYRLELVREFNF